MPNHKPVIFLAFANEREDNAKYLRNIPAEHNGIRKALQEAEKQGLCEIVERSNASIEQIIDVFQDSRYRDRIAVFHFGGHADGYQLLLETLLVVKDANSGLNQGLVGFSTTNSLAHGEGLVSFLSKQKGLQLVFFNGCTTERQAKELSEAGIPAVIGTASEISDEVATNLAIRLYNGIGQAMEIGRAWQEAKDEIIMRNGADNLRGLYRKDMKESLPNKLPWEIYKNEANQLDWKLENQNYNLQIETGNTKINMNMDLQEFKKQLISLIDNCEMDTFFSEVEKCSYDYDKPTYNSQKRNYTQTNPLLNPCAMFGQQWKVFVGTLKEKK